MKKISFAVACLVTFSTFAAELTERQKQFQLELEKAKTPTGQIKRAETLAKDPKSSFQIDAINYLIDHQVHSSGSLMIELTKNPNVSEFAIYGVGELQLYEATPLLIQYMRDDNRNVRGNAFRALQKMYPKEFMFEFHHDDPVYARNKTVDRIQNWWDQNKESLKNRTMQQMTPEEKKEAQERWEKYGKEYLQR